MKIKSYFANTVEEAMAMARQELGSDAMLVNSRKSSLENRHLGAYEVVFVSDMPPGETEEPATASTGQKRPAGDRLTQQMTELKKRAGRHAADHHSLGHGSGGVARYQS